MLRDGDLKFAADLGTGWGGEAFGKQLAAMTIEGNWIEGAMAADFPDVEFSVSEMPSGPAGKGTIAFTNCWGVSQASDHEKAVDLVEYLTTDEEQIKFGEAFGVIPSVQSAAEKWASENPGSEPFVTGAEYALTLPSQPGTTDVLTDLSSQLSTLKDGDPKTILSSGQQTLQAALDGQG
jgi:multiple sugar transport system substrate-binding protein